MFAIDLHNVSKTYKGKIRALEGVSMQVRTGEIFGLLGPNGAGKSTLVKIMMSVIRPTRAEGTVLGRAVGNKGMLRNVGYLPENHRFPRYLTGRQAVEFFGTMSGVDRTTRKRRTGELLELVGMAGAADRKISTYSKGMAQRMGLAQALVNEPDLVVLDEPTDGVDPGGRRDIREVLNTIRRQGKTVFVNSHLLSELEMVCDRVAILVNGQVAKQGTIDELTIAKQRYELELQSVDGQNVSALMSAALPGLFSTPPTGTVFRGTSTGGQWVEMDGPILRVGTTEAGDIQVLVDALRRAGLVIRRIQSVRPSLEELFVETVAANGLGGRR